MGRPCQVLVLYFARFGGVIWFLRHAIVASLSKPLKGALGLIVGVTGDSGDAISKAAGLLVVPLEVLELLDVIRVARVLDLDLFLVLVVVDVDLLEDGRVQLLAGLVSGQWVVVPGGRVLQEVEDLPDVCAALNEVIILQSGKSRLGLDLLVAEGWCRQRREELREVLAQASRSNVVVVSL